MATLTELIELSKHKVRTADKHGKSKVKKELSLVEQVGSSNHPRKATRCHHSASPPPSSECSCPYQHQRQQHPEEDEEAATQRLQEHKAGKAVCHGEIRKERSHTLCSPRADELYRSYACVLQRLAKEREMATPSFSPNLVSKQQPDRRPVPVFELLHMDAVLRSEKLMETQERRDKELRAMAAVTTTPRKKDRARGSGGVWGSPGGAGGSGHVMDRFQVLWEDSKTLQMKRTANAMKVPRECTYTPRLIAKGLQELRMERQWQDGDSPGGGRRSSSPLSLLSSLRSSPRSCGPAATRPSIRPLDCFTRLYSASRDVAAARKAREEQRQVELMDGCTFAPNLVRPSTSAPSLYSLTLHNGGTGSGGVCPNKNGGEAPANAQAGLRVFDRLDRQAEKQRARQKTYEKERLEREMKGCTWMPVLYRSFGNGGSGSNGDHKQQEQHPRHTQGISRDSDGAVSDGHDCYSGGGGGGSNCKGKEIKTYVFDRLYRQAAELRMRQILYDNLPSKECTFTPTLNRNSEDGRFSSIAVQTTHSGDDDDDDEDDAIGGGARERVCGVSPPQPPDGNLGTTTTTATAAATDDIGAAVPVVNPAVTPPPTGGGRGRVGGPSRSPSPSPTRCEQLYRHGVERNLEGLNPSQLTSVQVEEAKQLLQCTFSPETNLSRSRSRSRSPPRSPRSGSHAPPTLGGWPCLKGDVLCEGNSADELTKCSQAVGDGHVAQEIENIPGRRRGGSEQGGKSMATPPADNLTWRGTACSSKGSVSPSALIGTGTVTTTNDKTPATSKAWLETFECF